MRLNFTSGSLFHGFGLIGTGFTVTRPSIHFFGRNDATPIDRPQYPIPSAGIRSGASWRRARAARKMAPNPLKPPACVTKFAPL